MLRKIAKYTVIAIILVFVANVVYFATKKPNVALINIDGIITTAKANRIINSLNKAKSDPQIKAILIKINSGGGEAVASQRLYLAIKSVSKHKFTTALIEGVGASGAYYAACGANKIICYPASIVGSIGVIFETINVSKLANKLGISLFVVKTGKLKDVGNPFRKPTKEDKNMIRALIMSVYKQFLEAVSSSRNIRINKLKKIADGRVFSGKQALNLKLVDSTGGLKEVKILIKKQIHVKHVIFEEFTKHKTGIIGTLTEGINYIDTLTQPSLKAMMR